MCVYVLYMCVCVYIYVCVYIHIYMTRLKCNKVHSV